MYKMVSSIPKRSTHKQTETNAQIAAARGGGGGDGDGDGDGGGGGKLVVRVWAVHTQ